MRSHPRPPLRCEPSAYWRAFLPALVLVAAVGCTSTGGAEGEESGADARSLADSATQADAATPTSSAGQELPERQGSLRGTYAVPFSGWGDTPPEVAKLRASITFPTGFEVDDGSTMAETGPGSFFERRRLGFWTGS